MGKSEDSRWGVVLFLTMVFHLACVILQTGIIFMLFEFTIERREDHWEKEGSLANDTVALLNAIATDTPLDPAIFNRTLKLCEEDHNIPYSQSVMTLLWGAKILPSFWQGLMFTFILALRLPNASAGQACTQNEGGQLKIVRLPVWGKVIALVVVEIPRVAVTVYLYFMGAKFLMLAPSLGVLILKSIGLAFISQITDVLAQGFFSVFLQAAIKKTVVAFDDQGGDKDASQWNLWGSLLTKLILVLAVSLYYCRIAWGALQNMRGACTAYEYHFILPKCGPNCGSHLFGFTLYN